MLTKMMPYDSFSWGASGYLCEVLVLRGKLSALGVTVFLICALSFPQQANASLSASTENPVLSPAGAVFNGDSARRHILAATNEARSAAGLPPVSAHEALDEVAQACSQTQAANNAVAHCTGYQTRYPAGWTAASENVAAGQSVESVVDAWMNSAPHRANILRADATHLGIGYAVSSSGRPYYTQNFASYPRAVSAPPEVPIFRFYSPAYRGHFYTASEAERDMIRTRWPDVWNYEGSAYTAFTTQASGTVPLYRFWSAQYTGHFYTADAGERDEVIRRWPSVWAYEGVAYYVYPSESTVEQTVPVARFWGPTVLHHFYTASPSESDYVRQNWSSTWVYESNAFRVPASGAPLR